MDNSIPVKLSAKRKKELLDAIKPVYMAPAPPEDPDLVIARLKANEPKPVISKKPGGGTLDSTYSERRAAWEKALKREQERKEALRAGVGGITSSSEENQALAAKSEHLIRHLSSTSAQERKSKPKGRSKTLRSTKPGKGRRA